MRGKKAPIRQIKVDPRFQRVDLAKLINKIMNKSKVLKEPDLNL